MKLTAYTFAGPWRVWEDVDVWLLDGPKLIMRRGHTRKSMILDTVVLPREVIGLADDSPTRVVTPTQVTAYTPTPEKALRQTPRTERRDRTRDHR